MFAPTGRRIQLIKERGHSVVIVSGLQELSGLDPDVQNLKVACSTEFRTGQEDFQIHVHIEGIGLCKPVDLTVAFQPLQSPDTVASLVKGTTLFLIAAPATGETEMEHHGLMSIAKEHGYVSIILDFGTRSKIDVFSKVLHEYRGK